MPETIETKLGELIFNGTILFLSISFGLFTLSLGGGTVTITSIASFILLISLVILFAIASISLSFFGIKHNQMICIYLAGGCLLVVIVLLTIAYSQIYMQTLSQNVIIVNK